MKMTKSYANTCCYLFWKIAFMFSLCHGIVLAASILTVNNKRVVFNKDFAQRSFGEGPEYTRARCLLSCDHCVSDSPDLISAPCLDSTLTSVTDITPVGLMEYDLFISGPMGERQDELDTILNWVGQGNVALLQCDTTNTSYCDDFSGYGITVHQDNRKLESDGGSDKKFIIKMLDHPLFKHVYNFGLDELPFEIRVQPQNVYFKVSSTANAQVLITKSGEAFFVEMEIGDGRLFLLGDTDIWDYDNLNDQVPISILRQLPVYAETIMAPPPTRPPTSTPTAMPTTAPTTRAPAIGPTPSPPPTMAPTPVQTLAPTATPTEAPSTTESPTVQPTIIIEDVVFDGTTVIGGDLGILQNSTVRITGGSTLKIEGCLVAIDGNLEINVEGDIPENGTSVDVATFTCRQSQFNTVTVSESDPCKKVTATEQVYTSSKLSVVFSVDEVPCENSSKGLEWWALLLIVIAVVAVAGGIVLFILLHKPTRQKVFPFTSNFKKREAM